MVVVDLSSVELSEQVVRFALHFPSVSVLTLRAAFAVLCGTVIRGGVMRLPIHNTLMVDISSSFAANAISCRLLTNDEVSHTACTTETIGENILINVMI